jgi:hypothetical protein
MEITVSQHYNEKPAKAKLYSHDNRSTHELLDTASAYLAQSGLLIRQAAERLTNSNADRLDAISSALRSLACSLGTITVQS